MFNVDYAVADWRRKMVSGGVSHPATLDELESHLRGDWRALVAGGTPEAEAFQLAVSRLGEPGRLRTEFNKVKSAVCWPVTLGSWLFAIAIILMSVVFFGKVAAGKIDLLLCLHVLSITAGYGAALLAGGFGIFYVSCRSFRGLSSNRQQALSRAVGRFGPLSAGLVIAGTVMGMFWWHGHHGKYLDGDAKEFGAFCVFAWLVLLSVMNRLGGVSERVTMLMCIGGNVIVGLAWFGAAILMESPRTPGYLPLALSIFVGIHLVFLVLGLAPAPEAVQS